MLIAVLTILLLCYLLSLLLEPADLVAKLGNFLNEYRFADE